MPPRISVAAVARSSSSSCSNILANPPTIMLLRNSAQPVDPRASQSRLAFSTTSSLLRTSTVRKNFLKWLASYGKKYRTHEANSTNYLPRASADEASQGLPRPFPLNPYFESFPVLDDAARELVWRKVMREGETIKAVSAELGVDIHRVAAIVRLKEVEKDWVAKGKKLATPYAKAVLSMLPKTSFNPDGANRPHEPINEVHVHHATMKQIFWPTSESREFTRQDAAKAFHKNMLPTDERLPIPELVQMEKDLLSGIAPAEAKARFLDSAEKSERAAADAQRRKVQAEAAATSSVNRSRFEFRFKDYDSEDVGKDGRRIGAVGARYGMPHYDRMKGRVKIPTSVP